MCKCLCSTAVLLVVQQKCMGGFASRSRDHSNAANHPRPIAQWFLQAGSGSSPPFSSTPLLPPSSRPPFFSELSPLSWQQQYLLSPPFLLPHSFSTASSSSLIILDISPSFVSMASATIFVEYTPPPSFDGVGEILLSPLGPLNSLPSSSLADSNCFSAYSSSARRASAPSSFTTTFSSASSSFYFIILPLLVGGCLLSCHAIYSRHFATNQFRRARGSIHHRYILFSIRLQSEALDPRSYLLLP